MPQYILLLHEKPESFAGLGPDQIQAVILRYKEWSSKLRAEGKIVGGQKLEDGTGRVMRSSGGKTTVTNGPFSEGKELIGGYFIVEAPTYEDAVEISRGCPHLDFGTIEIRQIEVV